MKVYTATIILAISLGTRSHVETKDLSLPYYANARLVCDTSFENETKTINTSMPISNFMWLLPNGQVINAKQSRFDGSRIHVTFENSSHVLSIKKIDNEDFGVYWCVVMRNGSSLRAFRHTLNIDGVPMEDYHKQQIRNAIVGSVSAGVLLLICLICYVIWYFRCSEKVRRKRKLVEELEKGINNYDTRFYDNVGLELYTKKKDKY